MQKKNSRQALIDKTNVSVKQANVMAGSVNTAYLSAGMGFPVICLHGGGAGAVTWYPSIGPLSKKFHVIVPDIVGYGESDKPDATYDRAYFCTWLKHFLESLEISKAHIMGLSQGGAIALQFAIDSPGTIDKLILVDSGALGSKSPLLSILGMVWLNTLPSSTANRFYSRYLLFNPENRDVNHGLYSVEVLKRKGGKKAFSQGRGSAVSALPEADLCKIQNKTLVIWGENDRLFPVKYGAKAVKTMPNAKLLSIKNAGHLPLMDQPAVFNQAVADFLQS